MLESSRTTLSAQSPRQRVCKLQPRRRLSSFRNFPNDTWDVTDKRPTSDALFEGASRHDGEGFLTISGCTRHWRGRSAQVHQKSFPTDRAIWLRGLHKDGSVVDQ